MKKLDHKRLAEGEATGHYHGAIAEDAMLFGNEENEPSRLSAPSGSDVTHQEHGRVTLPPGDYDIGRVQEWDHAEEEARQVED